MTPTIGMKVVFERGELDRLIDELRNDGYAVLGPVVGDGAIVYEEVTSTGDLPKGWRDRAEAGTYRLEHSEDDVLFGYSVGPQGWKRHLYPPRQRLFRAERAGRGFRVLRETDEPPRPMAFLGVRACELSAIQVLDRVFGDQSFSEPGYQGRRRQNLIIAVECARSVSTCFCTSMGTGPAVGSGFDLRLNELEGGSFLAEAGTEVGGALLGRLACREASNAECAAAAAQPAAAAAEQQERRMHPDAAGILSRSLESPHWEEVAKRCLTCGNCTMVCPTCFCTTVEDVTDLTGNNAERWRNWDSCFTIDYSHIAGGALRQKASSRYRQWINHKLSTWHQQFGTSGCVGCGRCIAWCPVGIDITEEVHALSLAEEGR